LSDATEFARLLFRVSQFSHSTIAIFLFPHFFQSRVSSAAFSTAALSASAQQSTLHLYEPLEIRQWTTH